MKKIIVLSVFAGLIFAGCKKNDAVPSTGSFTVSYPTITVSGNPYYSIAVGGSLPNITATAYDSFYRESTSVIVDQSTLDANTPGLYAVTISSKNKYGMTAYSTVYVGVTNISASLDLTGTYIRTVAPANPNRVAHISKVANGMFLTDNGGGVDVTDATTGPLVSAVFMVTDPTTIDFGTQLTSAGSWSAGNEALSLAVGDTTIAYSVVNSNFGTQVRTFVKQ